jgi:DOMON domain
MKSKLIYCVLSLLIFLKLNAQTNIQAGKMIFESIVEDNSILIKIKVPTKGWLAVGFNTKNGIVGSDLKMFSVKNGVLESEDQFVKGVQNHPTDVSLGGMNNIKLLEGMENEDGTSITFKIPLCSDDRFDFSHSLNQNLWLILAYSVEDDFGHHSIMRQHFQIRW